MIDKDIVLVIMADFTFILNGYNPSANAPTPTSDFALGEMKEVEEFSLLKHVTDYENTLRTSPGTIKFANSESPRSSTIK